MSGEFRHPIHLRAVPGAGQPAHVMDVTPEDLEMVADTYGDEWFTMEMGALSMGIPWEIVGS